MAADSVTMLEHPSVAEWEMLWVCEMVAQLDDSGVAVKGLNAAVGKVALTAAAMGAWSDD